MGKFTVSLSDNNYIIKNINLDNFNQKVIELKNEIKSNVVHVLVDILKEAILKELKTTWNKQ